MQKDKLIAPSIKDQIKTPSDPNIIIWRYMEFSKFCSLLVDKSLFFSRADLLGDHFEGSYPKYNKDFRGAFYDRVFEDYPQMKAQASNMESEMARILQKAFYVNCWHINQQQSAAMWSIYAKDNKGIAIQSTYKLLRDCLPNEIFISEVSYIDYDKDILPIMGHIAPYVHKRKSFEHEKELRAFKMKVEGHELSHASVSNNPVGINISVDINHLVEKIYIAPYAEEWFQKVIINISQQYGLSESKVTRSNLDEEPFF